MGVPKGAHLEMPTCPGCGYRVYPNRVNFPDHLCPEEREQMTISPMLYRDTAHRLMTAQRIVQGRRPGAGE